MSEVWMISGSGVVRKWIFFFFFLNFACWLCSTKVFSCSLSSNMDAVWNSFCECFVSNYSTNIALLCAHIIIIFGEDMLFCIRLQIAGAGVCVHNPLASVIDDLLFIFSSNALRISSATNTVHATAAVQPKLHNAVSSCISRDVSWSL